METGIIKIDSDFFDSDYDDVTYNRFIKDNEESEESEMEQKLDY
ncbi:hypothetical protein [Thomasclavelia cocleata]|nr:hypothetical protein [Thomasclavelia cocleata]